jgi:hypothetical protein
MKLDHLTHGSYTYPVATVIPATISYGTLFHVSGSTFKTSEIKAEEGEAIGNSSSTQHQDEWKVEHNKSAPETRYYG